MKEKTVSFLEGYHTSWEKDSLKLREEGNGLSFNQRNILTLISEEKEILIGLITFTDRMLELLEYSSDVIFKNG